MVLQRGTTCMWKSQKLEHGHHVGDESNMEEW